MVRSTGGDGAGAWAVGAGEAFGPGDCVATFFVSAFEAKGWVAATVFAGCAVCGAAAVWFCTTVGESSSLTFCSMGVPNSWTTKIALWFIYWPWEMPMPISSKFLLTILALCPGLFIQ